MAAPLLGFSRRLEWSGITCKQQMAGKYKEYKSLNFAQIATEILEFWKMEKIFEKSVSNREGSPSFTFYEGPPSANGTPGIHHVMGRTVKDIFCRFKTLQGYQVKRNTEGDAKDQGRTWF